MLPRLVLTFLLVGLRLAAQTAPVPPLKPTLTEALLQARTALTISESGFSGAGAQVLTEAVAQSRFVLVGEDHITREIPQVAAALCDVMHPDAYAVEAGPGAASFVNGLLHSPDRVAKTAQRLKAHPNNMAFLDVREENDLAAHCAASSHNPQFELWGLDQDFVGSAGTLLDEMAAGHPGPQATAAIAAAQTKEHAADMDARASGDPSKLFLLGSTDADMQALTQGVMADGTATTRRVLHEFQVSREIYLLNAAGSPESNRKRAVLLKQHFLEDYLPLKQGKSDARVLLKFGDDHNGKGFNVLHQRDLGNFIAELADGEGAQSLHVMVLGARGTHAAFAGYNKPFGREPFVMIDDPEYKFLAPAVSDLIPADAGTAGLAATLFDLRKLRFHGVDMSADWQRVAYGYDLLILLPSLSPAAQIE